MKYPLFEKYIYRAFDKLWQWWPEKTLLRKIAHKGPSGWFMCQKCGGYYPKQLTHVDHISPKKPIQGPVRLEDGWLDLNALRKSYLPDREFLQILCIPCHKEKTRGEQQERRRFKVRPRKA